MGLPRGLTDISIHLQTREEHEEYRRAMADRDFGRIDDLKPAVILHFGKTQVRLSTSMQSIQRAGRQITEIQKAINEGRVKVETPVFDSRPTAWLKLGNLPFDD